MAAAKKTPNVEYDFDNWNEEAEAAAIAALAPKFNYIIVEQNFVGRFRDGTIIKLPLTIKLEQVNHLTSASPDPVDQVTEILTTLGGDEAAQTFVSQSLTDATALAMKYFELFERIAGAALPE